MSKSFFTPVDIAAAKAHATDAGKERDKTPYDRMMQGIAPIIVERMMIEVNGGTSLPDLIDDLARVAGWIMSQALGQLVANDAPQPIMDFAAARVVKVAMAQAQGCIDTMNTPESHTKVFSGTTMGEA